MIKFTSPTDFDWDVEPIKIIKEAKTLEKRGSVAGDLKFEKTANQTDVHVIALGAFEGTGANRNSDVFLEKDCINNHHTFVKAARAVHRHHKNKPSDPKFGNIKASAYNHPMKRIELVVGLDNDKCQDELHKLANGEQIPFSMASRQDHDICSWCKKAAKSDEDRCEHIPRDLGKINKVGTVCNMINPDPNWFEISIVRRPADRIAYSLKQASAAYTPMLPSDYLAMYPDLVVPTKEVILSKRAADKREILKKLSEMEKHMDAVAANGPKDSKDKVIAESAKLNNGPKLSDQTIDELRKYNPSKLLKALADNGIVFSPEEFMKYLFGGEAKKEDVDGMKTHLPSVFSDLEDDDDGETLNSERFEPSFSSMLPPQMKNLVQSLFSDHSMFPSPAKSRVIRITIIGKPKAELAKSLPEEGKSKEASHKLYAKEYANYKLACLNYLNEFNKVDEDLLWNVLVQNR